MLADRAEYNKYMIMEKYFILMPLMHSEDPKYTSMCVTEFVDLDKEVREKMPEIYEGSMTKMLQLGIKYAQDHDAIVKYFGRYPHRNEVLGRQTTPEEQEYL